MFKKILNAIYAYFSALNMNPGASGFIRRIRANDTGTYKADSLKNRIKKSVWMNGFLFFITVFTTTLAGAWSGNTMMEILLSGLPFSLTLMAILLSHEMGHYLTARYFGVSATLPYFIPFPSIIGTMGAVIKLRSPINDRRSLLYIGAMGPLAGFILSLTASVIGIYLSEIKPVPQGDGVIIFGDSLLTAFLTRMIQGQIPPGYDIYLSPYAWAGWIGFLVTSLNLMPMGQLDGSRIVYALIGRKQLYIGWTVFAALIILSFIWPGWIVWIFMALVFLMIGHPYINEGNPLTTREKMIGWICVLIFVLTFIPMPVKI